MSMENPEAIVPVPPAEKPKPTVMPKKEKEFKQTFDSLDELNFDLVKDSGNESAQKDKKDINKISEILKNATVHIEEPVENIGNLKPSSEEIKKFNDEIRAKELEEYRDSLTQNGKEIKFTPEEEMEFQDTIKTLGYDKGSDKKPITSNSFGSTSTFKVPEKAMESEEIIAERAKNMGIEMTRELHPHEKFDPKYHPKQSDLEKSRSQTKKASSENITRNKDNKKDFEPERDYTERSGDIADDVSENEPGITFDSLVRQDSADAEKLGNKITEELNKVKKTQSKKSPEAENLSTSQKIKTTKETESEIKTEQPPKPLSFEEKVENFNRSNQAIIDKQEKDKLGQAEKIDVKTEHIEAPFIPAETHPLSPLDKFSLKNKSFFSRMKEGARNMAIEFYDKAIKFPTKGLLGKFGMGYNQFFADWNEKTAIKHKTQIDAINITKGMHDKSISDMHRVITEMRAQGSPGSESLQLKIREIEDQKRKLDVKSNKIQSKFKRFDNETKIYTNRRDRIADELIGNYDEKLKPMEKKLDELKSANDELDVLETVASFKHRDEQTRLDNIKKQIETIDNALTMTGSSHSEIRKMVKPLQDIVNLGEEKIRLAKEEFKDKREKINEAIADADRKANPYRDNREEFVRMKERQPIEMNVPKRKGAEIYNTEEEIRTNERSMESSDSENESDAFTISESRPENAIPKSEKPKVLDLISAYNNHLKERKVKNADIDPRDFIKISKLGIKDEFNINDFKKILKSYLKFKKVSDENLADFPSKKK